MKRILAAIFVICLCLGLCACSEAAGSATSGNTSSVDQKYVGVWELSEDVDGFYGFRSVQLFSNGKVILATVHNVDERSSASAGEWMVEGDQLIVFVDSESFSWKALNFHIVSKTELKLGDYTYNKK